MSGFEKRQTLTTRQREIYEFLRDKILNRGYGPTVREIGTHFSIRSPNGVMCHLKALERKGLIVRESNMSRAIQLADNPKQKTSLPLVGTAVSGSPFQRSAAEQRVEFGGLFESANRVCIVVEGNAYAALGICDGDHIIVGTDMPGHPDTLVAGIDDRDGLVLMRASDNGEALRPAVSGAYPVTPKQTLGVVVGIVRRFAAADPTHVVAAANGDH